MIGRFQSHSLNEVNAFIASNNIEEVRIINIQEDKYGKIILWYINKHETDK